MSRLHLWNLYIQGIFTASASHSLHLLHTRAHTTALENNPQNPIDHVVTPWMCVCVCLCFVRSNRWLISKLVDMNQQQRWRKIYLCLTFNKWEGIKCVRPFISLIRVPYYGHFQTLIFCPGLTLEQACMINYAKKNPKTNKLYRPQEKSYFTLCLQKKHLK